MPMSRALKKRVCWSLCRPETGWPLTRMSWRLRPETAVGDGRVGAAKGVGIAGNCRERRGDGQGGIIEQPEFVGGPVEAEGMQRVMNL